MTDIVENPRTLDVEKIMDLLPHRYPFLMVDRVLDYSITEEHKTLKALKNITFNEPFFQGHFPEEPIMPGVLIVEAMAQCGGLLAVNSVEDKSGYSTYFLRIDNVRFKHKVTPGDTLQMECELAAPMRRGIASLICKAFVGGTLVCEAELMAQIVKNK